MAIISSSTFFGRVAAISGLALSLDLLFSPLELQSVQCMKLNRNVQRNENSYSSIEAMLNRGLAADISNTHDSGDTKVTSDPVLARISATNVAFQEAFKMHNSSNRNNGLSLPKVVYSETVSNKDVLNNMIAAVEANVKLGETKNFGTFSQWSQNTFLANAFANAFDAVVEHYVSSVLPQKVYRDLGARMTQETLQQVVKEYVKNHAIQFVVDRNGAPRKNSVTTAPHFDFVVNQVFGVLTKEPQPEVMTRYFGNDEKHSGCEMVVYHPGVLLYHHPRETLHEAPTPSEIKGTWSNHFDKDWLGEAIDLIDQIANTQGFPTESEFSDFRSSETQDEYGKKLRERIIFKFVMDDLSTDDYQRLQKKLKEHLDGNNNK